MTGGGGGGMVAFLTLRRSVDGRHLTRFQSEASVFKFVQRGVNGSSVKGAQSRYFELF